MCRQPCVRAGKLKARCPCCSVDPTAARVVKRRPPHGATRTYAEAVVPAPTPTPTPGLEPVPVPAPEPAQGLALLCMAYEADADAESQEAV